VKATALDEKGRPKVGTLHPIVEGAVAIVAAVAGDAHRTLTVSVVDEGDDDRLAYSVPCVIGRDGVVERHADVTKEPRVADLLERCLAELRAQLHAAS
jgi:malate/lactate dehydrogenase